MGVAAPFRGLAPWPSVLVVDDDRLVRRAFGRMLAGVANVLLAVDARDALAQLEQVEVDAIVSDHDMPGMSGLELLDIVRRRLPAVTRILVSGSTFLDRAAVLETAHVFLPKPVARDALVAVLSQPSALPKKEEP